MFVDDADRLRYMRDAARSALRFVAGRERENLAEDEMLLFSVIRALEIIGEAASKITEPTKRKYPRVPWRQVIGMRNWLSHAYFQVEPDLVWETVTEELPVLLEELGEV
jgi:uncharacterized protein with HEPN domain